MEVISYIALFIVIIAMIGKGSATIGSIIWIIGKGDDYKEKILKIPSGDRTGKHLRKILVEMNADKVWPFGVLDYKLTEMGGLYAVIGRSIYRVPYIIAFGLLSFLLLYLCDDVRKSAVYWGIMSVYVEFVITCTAVETFIAYVSMGSYRRIYHKGVRAGPDETVAPGRPTYELVTLVPLILTVAASNVLMVLSSAISWKAFNICDGLSPLHGMDCVIDSMYFVSETISTVGYGDIHPADKVGKLLSILMNAQGMILLLGVASSLLTFGLTRDHDAPSTNPGLVPGRLEPLADQE